MIFDKFFANISQTCNKSSKIIYVFILGSFEGKYLKYFEISGNMPQYHKLAKNIHFWDKWINFSTCILFLKKWKDFSKRLNDQID